MLITFISMGYVYISKICFDFLKRIIPHTSLASMFCYCLTSYCAFRSRTLLQSLLMNRLWLHIYRTHSSQLVT